MTLQKPLDEEVEKVSMYFNTETVTVYHSGISDKSYQSLIDNLVSKLVIFSSYGSGWKLLAIEKVTLILVKCVAVRDSSYIPFNEGHPLRRDSNLLNIHNGSDDNCFLYCYTAGYHIVYKKEKLEPPAPCFRPGRILLHTAERTRQPRCRKGTLKCQ